jgi:hypothetical protein
LLVLPPPIVLAVGAACGWVLSGFIPKSASPPHPGERFVGPALSSYLNEALKSVYMQVAQDLRDDGCEIHPSQMPEDIRSALVHYLWGATLAVEEDLQDAKGAHEWVVQARLLVLQWVIVPVDEERGLIEINRFTGKELNEFAVFAVLGGGAMRDLLERGANPVDMKGWIDSYKSAFLPSARLYTNYR